MAEEIGRLCREYVAQNAAALRHLGEREAVEKLVEGLRPHLASHGWHDGDEDYHLPLRERVREALRLHRR